jgi:hypothetical protein
MATMYRFNRLSDVLINGEIQRLGNLLEAQENLWRRRQIIEMLKPIKSTTNENFTAAKNFHETNIKYLKTKRRFWSQHRDNSMDKDALEKLQEEMAEWITNGWSYLGMEEHEEQNENVKEEFQMFKLMFENTPKKQKRKKNKK